jgi:hypothetical protein
MDHDDPEKRVADLENRLAGQSPGGYQPPAQQPPKPDPAWWSRTTRRSRRHWFVVFGTGLFAFLGLADGVNDVLNYSHGTPTAASIISCSGKGACYGTWNTNGASQDGLIEHGFGKPRAGGTVDVRVRDGKGYLRDSWLPSFVFGGGFLVVSISALVGGRNRPPRR